MIELCNAILLTNTVKSENPQYLEEIFLLDFHALKSIEFC